LSSFSALIFYVCVWGFSPVTDTPTFDSARWSISQISNANQLVCINNTNSILFEKE
jgi:hypothetical protein